ncbi:MAG: ferrochelatase [Sandaracinaceae bacterium]|nr:ferrochelatase [Sandaracinaceae bacterium]
MAGPDLSALEAADARLARAFGPLGTLDPSRAEATSSVALYATLAPRCQGIPGMAEALAGGLVSVADATIEHFPDNQLFDFDALAAALVRDSADAAALAATFDDVVSLHALFGRRTAIRFRYVHDFVYGFDWAKWVRRDPAKRAGVGPFQRRFLKVLLGRGQELLQLIATDDAKYPLLSDDQPRNPFSFSREPADELRLHRELAAEGLLPVEAWRVDAVPVWDRPFADLRAERAAHA